MENITAIIKVKDSPGALWNAIHKIGVSKIIPLVAIIYFSAEIMR